MRPAPPSPRPQDWPDRLVAYLAGCRRQPFAWGVHDCASFAAGWVLALRGVDPLENHRGSYASEAEFEGLVQAHGGLAALVEVAALAHGLPECPPAFAQRGDVVLVEVGNMLGLGIVDAVGVTIPGPDGLRVVPRRAIRRAWVI